MLKSETSLVYKMLFITAATVHQIYEMCKSDFIYQEVLKKYFPSKDIREEFNQELWLNFFEKPDKVIKAWNGKYFRYFYIAVIKNQVLSNSSDWHINFRKPGYDLYEYLPESSEQDELFLEEQLNEEKKEKQKQIKKIEVVEEALQHFERINPKFMPNAKMFRMHFNDGLSYRQIGKKMFGTPSTTVCEYINEAKVLIQHYIRKYYPELGT